MIIKSWGDPSGNCKQNYKQMKTFLLSCLVLLSICNYAAENKEKTKKDEVSMDWYGFVRTDFFVDTYKGINAFHEQYYLFPDYAGTDDGGKAINEQTSSNFMPISTRLGVKVSGPEIFNAKTKAHIEFDFAGKPNCTVFRIRHAYFTFDWDKSQLLLGQTWHPFWGGGSYPTVGSLNTGAPFQPFNRSPQIRYNYKLNDLTLSASAVYELQYQSYGPNSEGKSEKSDQYARNAAIPESVLSAEYKHGSWTAGAGAGYKLIQPRLTTTGTAGTFVSDETLGCKEFNGYVQYKKSKFMIKGKAVYGENLAHMLMLGGYGVNFVNEATGAETYSPYQHVSGLLNIVYGKKWQIGAFLGYSENLGTVDPLLDNGEGKATVYGLKTDIQKLYRVAPHVALNVSKLRMVAEYEMTSADYGVDAFDFADGLYGITDNATNHRFLLSAVYFF